MRRNFEERNIDMSDGEKDPDTLREESIGVMKEDNNGDK